MGTIQGLKFLPNKAILTKESLVILDEAVTVLTEHNKVKVEIGGHPITSACRPIIWPCRSSGPTR